MHADHSNIQPLITPPSFLAPCFKQSLSHLYNYSFYFVNLLSIMRVLYVPVGLELSIRAPSTQQWGLIRREWLLESVSSQ